MIEHALPGAVGPAVHSLPGHSLPSSSLPARTLAEPLPSEPFDLERLLARTPAAELSPPPAPLTPSLGGRLRSAPLAILVSLCVLVALAALLGGSDHARRQGLFVDDDVVVGCFHGDLALDPKQRLLRMVHLSETLALDRE